MIKPSNHVFRPAADGAIEAISDQQAKPTPALAAIHAALLAFVEHDAYPCVGAKSAIQRGAYRFGVYGELGSSQAVADLTHDLQWFASSADSIDPGYASFLTVFDGPAISDEAQFETLLWQQLQAVNCLDAQAYDWDRSVSDDPAEPDFSFSVGSHAFFIVGMHPAANREARRFPYPTLVWNLHSQFERLREQGLYERMKHVIREREAQLQGEGNPELSDHGAVSEARQYSGRQHDEPHWRCPFHAARRDDTGAASR